MDCCSGGRWLGAMFTRDGHAERLVRHLRQIKRSDVAQDSHKDRQTVCLTGPADKHSSELDNFRVLHRYFIV